tara:strand:+ start:550 stop:708 length:159 start_codon:yes stop_codon:yes gene_type:complete
LAGKNKKNSPHSKQKELKKEWGGVSRWEEINEIQKNHLDADYNTSLSYIAIE